MMLHYSQFNTVAAIPIKIRKKINGKMQSVLCDDNIYTLDTETTSLFVFADRTEKFDKSKPPEYYKTAVSVGYMYIWTISINDTVYYGRTGAELLEFMAMIKNAVKMRFIVYVHNLSFDFQFIRNYITDFDVFARSPRQPLTAYTPTFNAEFRDSLALTNCKLEKLTDVFDLPVSKQTGSLDYNIIRNSCTPLTETELKYCEYDNLVLYHCILKFKSIYGNVAKIPLTQTGIIRKECQAIYAKDNDYHKHIKSIYPQDHKTFYFLMRCFFGGYVHANYIHANRIIENVQSWDFASSYPTVMLCEKYPQTNFVKSCVQRFDQLLEDDYAYLLDITFYNVNAKTYNHYISISKCYDLYNVFTDNGRIVSADCMRCYITNIDLQIMRKCYKFSDYKINKAMRAKLGYLDRRFLLKILELYGAKTKLKGVEGKNLEYQLSKQKVNALYGMSVTNLIKDSFEFKNNEWSDVKQLTDIEVNVKLQEIAKSYATFLTPAYGVFVTAYARRNLWDNILKIDSDLIYADTDSLKFIGNHSDVIDAYNKKIIKKLRKACKENDIDVALLAPADIDGNTHQLGVFDNDGNYNRFITMGAKKYAYEDNSGLHITVSGVNSKTGAKGLQRLENFQKGFLFDYDAAGKKLITYNDTQIPVEIIDEYGNKETRTELFGVCMRDNVYKLGIEGSYLDYILKCPNYSIKCSNIDTTHTI